MKKTMKLGLLVCLALFACALMLTACGHTHTFGEWITIKESTTEEKGLAQRYCSECSYTESKALDLHVHTFGEWALTISPTCSAEGMETRVCACGTRENQTVLMISHTMIADNYQVAASCTSVGQKATEKCSVCGYREIEILPPLGHNLADQYEGHLSCATCGLSSTNIDCWAAEESSPWYQYYVVYSSYEIEQGNMSYILMQYDQYDVIVPRRSYIDCILPTLFKGSHLASITMSDNISDIGESAFFQCNYLTYVRLPSSIQKIGSRAFDGCHSLAYIQYDGTMAQWNAIEKGDDWDDRTGDYVVYCTDGIITK